MMIENKIKYLFTGLTGLLFLFCFSLYAQPERNLVRKGNKQYEDGKFADAEITYRKSLDKNKNSSSGSFNLGDALYKLEKYDEAAQQFSSNTALIKDKDLAAKNYHNLGNSLLKAKKYDQSVLAYKNALKLSPADNDTRYNLAYAQNMLKQQEQQNKDNKENKENKDQKNKEQQQKEQQQQAENKKEEQQKEQQAKQQKQKISKEDAERILQALKNNERELQKRLAKKEGEKVRIDKQW